MLKEYRTLLPYYKKYGLQYVTGVIFLFITNGGQLLIPQFIKKSINLMQIGNPDLEQILHLMLLMVLTGLIIAVGRFFWRYFIIGSSRRIERNLREQIFFHLLSMDSQYFAGQKTGDLMARMTNDMRAVRMASGIALVAFMDGLFMTIAILWLLFASYPSLAAVTIIPLPVITLIVLFFGSFLGDRFKEVQDRYSDLSARIQESLSGIRVIKTFNREKSALENFHSDNDRYLKANISLVKIWGLMHPVVGFLTGLTACLLLFFGGRQVIMGKLLPGDFVAVMSYLGMMAWPMIGAGFTVNLIQRGAASLKRINGILDAEPGIINTPSPVTSENFESLEIRDLNFSYPEGPVLNHLNLTVRKGETLGILGRTGSGKSTLINLMPRILESSRGSLYYNGTEIHDLELSSLRKRISVIPQDCFLFSDTIKANIAYGYKDATDDEIERITELTSLKKDLKNFPKGLDTQVGEKGVTLSGGQKQRIALSRALISRPDLLILDDALSAVDTKTEETILSGFFSERKGMTNILISHRVSTLMNADRIIVLDRGKIIQEGTHEELVAESGLYQKIHRLQSLERNE